MLKLEDTAEPAANFALDLVGLATRHEFNVLRWGLMADWNCLVSKDDDASHHAFIAADVELVNPQQADAFITDAMIAGLFCRRGDEFIHVQSQPFHTVVL